MTMASGAAEPPASVPASTPVSVATNAPASVRVPTIIAVSAPISGRTPNSASTPVQGPGSLSDPLADSLAIAHAGPHPGTVPHPGTGQGLGPIQHQFPIPVPPPTGKAAASNLSEVDRGRIVGMWEAGRKPTAIALAIPCSKRTACKWINAYRNCGKEGLVDLRRSGLAGRPRKTTEDENLAILKVMDENHTRAATSSALAALQLRVSDRTIRRRLQEARAERRKRPSQTRAQKLKLAHAHAHAHAHANHKERQTQYVQGELPPTSRMESMKDPLTLHDKIEPSALVEVNMDTHTPPLETHLLSDTGPCCYVNL